MGEPLRYWRGQVEASFDLPYGDEERRVRISALIEVDATVDGAIAATMLQPPQVLTGGRWVTMSGVTPAVYETVHNSLCDIAIDGFCGPDDPDELEFDHAG